MDEKTRKDTSCEMDELMRGLASIPIRLYCRLSKHGLSSSVRLCKLLRCFAKTIAASWLIMRTMSAM